MTFVLFLLSLAALIKSSDVFVDSAVLTAKRFRVSSLVIGMTMVAIGTSLPEVAASVTASLKGYPEIVLGNVIGSNICNIGLILGLAAFFAPISAKRKVLYQEGSFMVLLSIALWAIAWFYGEINRTSGALFLLLFCLSLLFVLRRSQKNRRNSGDGLEQVIEVVEAEEDPEDEIPPLLKLALKAILSLIILLGSCELLIQTTVEFAKILGVSQNVIALTMIALGTSLPELSVSIASAKRKEGDILVGNIIGSNISNILLVLGVAASLEPLSIKPITSQLDLPLMLIFALCMLLFLHKTRGLTRPNGGILLSLYALFLIRCACLS